MMMEPFYNKFPKVAEKETRCVIIPKGRPLPAGEYYMSESFCDDKKCDCRRVFINVIYNDNILATIGYGWEDLKFYEKWMGDKELAKDVKGPILEIGGVSTKYSQEIFTLFKTFMMQDKIFIDRLKEHYEMFKKSSEKKKSNFEDKTEELENFDPDLHTIVGLCKEIGTGFDCITDNVKEAFYPILMAIEETIWSEYLKDSSLKDSEVIESIKNIRDNIFSENTKFNEVEKNIVKRLKLVLFLNNYNKRDVSLSISCVLKSAKLHKSVGGNRGYLTFISGFFNEMIKK